MPDLADTATQKENRKKQKLQEQQFKNDLCAVMGMPQGRRIVWGLLEDAGLYRVSYAHGDQPQDMAFREGNRNMGLKLLGHINRECPELYLKMHEEHTHGRSSSGNTDSND